MALVSASAFAHGDKHADQGKKEAKVISTDEKDFGREGDPKKQRARFASI